MSQKINYHYETEDGIQLEPGTEFTLAGEKGKRYSFIKHVVADGSEWIDCFGGTTSKQQSRSVNPSRIAKVIVPKVRR
jgi:hypothetical protein